MHAKKSPKQQTPQNNTNKQKNHQQKSPPIRRKKTHPDWNCRWIHKYRDWNWVQWLINQSFSLPSRWTLTGWSNRQAETSWSWTRSAKSCTWGGLTPHSSDCLAGKQSPASATRAKEVPLQQRLQRMLTEPWGALGGLLPPGWRKWLCPSQCWWGPISKTLSNSGPPMREMKLLERVQWRASKRIKGLN